jgi:phage tail sheath gpL-like
MAVSTGIPNSWKLPLFWAVVDGTKAGNVTEPQRALLVGQMFTAGTDKGTASPDVPIPVGSIVAAQFLFGRGSMLARMVEKFMASNTTQQLWCAPVAEPTAGTAATGTIGFAATGLQAGVLTIYIAGQSVQINVASTDAASAIATNFAAAVNAIKDLPVTATASTSTVTLTCKWKGDTGNDITITPNYYGLFGGEVTPVGLTLTITAMTGGLGQPSFINVVSAIQSTEFDYVAMPFSDTTSLVTWGTEYGFGQTGRWNYTRQQYGIIFNAKRDTYANLLTWGLAQNQPVISTMAVETDSPAAIWEWTAAYCALGSLGFSADPARPLQTLEFYGILPARVQNRFSQNMNNSLVNSGLAVQATAPSGNPMILREQTQYQLNSFGQGDTAFGLLTVLATLQELLRRMKSAITSKYPRHKLIPDGTKIGPGQAAVTPNDLKAELVAEYGNAIYDGLAADMANFKANLIVEIDNNDPNRVNVLWPPRLAGQLRQFNALAQFRLQYAPQLVA